MGLYGLSGSKTSKYNTVDVLYIFKYYLYKDLFILIFFVFLYKFLGFILKFKINLMTLNIDVVLI
jgi:hypothetical protein